MRNEPMGLFPGKTATIEELADGASIAVPNDTTNEARALLLLETNGLITLREGAGMNATKLDIVDNPKNLDIQEVERLLSGPAYCRTLTWLSSTATMLFRPV